MPKHHDVVQGSPEWERLRMGRPTSSDFNKIITPTGALSKQADAYANKLITELMLGSPLRTLEPTYWMERGSVMEVEARQAYELIEEVTVERGGFITDDEEWFGCSPDGLISKEGGLEIKCPAPHTHMDYLINQTIQKTYKPQYQGQMLIADLEYVDLFSYHPDLPPVRIRMYRDEEYIKRLHDGLLRLRNDMNEKIEKLVAAGHMIIQGYEAPQQENILHAC